MKVLPLRLLLTGSCHPHSGKLVSFAVPVESGLTVEQMIKEFIIPNWPQSTVPVDFSGCTLGLLKAGVRLEANKPFDDYLSAAELGLGVSSTAGDATAGSSESHAIRSPSTTPEKGSIDPSPSRARLKETVLMHLFFRRKLPQPAPPQAPSTAAPPPPQPVQQQEQSSGCCAAM